MWVEGITDPSVGTSRGMLALGEIIELDDEEGGFLVDRNQVIEIPAPGAPAVPEGADVDESGEE